MSTFENKNWSIVVQKGLSALPCEEGNELDHHLHLASL